MEAITENPVIDLCIQQIAERRLSSGGFSEQPGRLYRPDSTALAVLVLAQTENHSSLADSGRSTLAAKQLKDGRVAFPEDKDAYWPTSLAVLAWHRAKQFEQVKSSALNFLLAEGGNTSPYNPSGPVGHDTSIKGWAWIAKTHSFVDPTALSLLALEINGLSAHVRFRDGINMLMNRQLAHGGWNYGNTLVYGKELFPFVDTTGVALAALAGHVAKEEVSGSLNFLRKEAERCRTPLSLAWALFGLGAWGEFPEAGFEWIIETTKRQAKYGPYGTSLLSLLALAYLSGGDFRKICA